MKGRERELRRARHVLDFVTQFYAQTIPEAESITVPRCVTVPLLQVSKELQHAPYVTYSDHALNNWSHKEPREEGALPTSDNLKAQTTFTGTVDENEFHMTDIRIELKGAEALELLRLTTEEIVNNDKPNVSQITENLEQAAVIITKVKDILMTTTKHVSPELFFASIRPWLMGADADPFGRKWVWEGSEDVEGSAEMLTKISGPTAGQSPLVPALDAYLGLEEDDSKSAFLDRVRVYMIRRHEAFLQHLRSNGRPIRSFVQKILSEQGPDAPVVAAYDAAVKAMKGFRDAHLIIVTLYVIVPARHAKMKAENAKKAKEAASPTAVEVNGAEQKKAEWSKKTEAEKSDRPAVEAAITGSQGFLLMKFLKGFRDQTNNGYVG